MLEQNVIEANKTYFLDLLSTIERPNAALDMLTEWLETSDFFTAPASTKYHGAYPGGLCEHSLDVYKNMEKLLSLHPEYYYESDTVKIVSLLHDLAKVNFYKRDFRNKKVYHENGSKQDNNGRFDWVSEATYAVDHDNRFVYGNHEETSEFLVRQYIPLSVEESVALLHHHAGMSWDSTKADISVVYNKYPLAAFLHTADMLSTFIDQRL